MAHELHALLGEDLSHPVSFTWKTRAEWLASLEAVLRVDRQHVDAHFLPHVHHRVHVFTPDFPGAREMRQLMVIPGHAQDPRVPPTERVVLWSDGQLAPENQPEHKVFVTEAAANAYEQTVTEVQGWFDRRVIPGPGFVPVWDAKDLQQRLENHLGEDPLNLVARYRQARQAKAFRAGEILAIDLDTGEWVSPTWQPGEPVATFPVLEEAPTPPQRRSRARRA
jgi:hypothetical protein